MTSRDKRSTVAAEIPVDVHEALKDADIPMWEVITDAVRTELGLEEEGTTYALERKVESLESQNDILEREIESKREQIRSNNNDIERLQKKIQEIEDQQASYHDILNRILGDMVKNPQTNIEAFRSDLREGAKIEYGRATESTIEKVVDDVIEHSQSETYDIRPERFNGHMDEVNKTESFGTELTAVSGGDNGSE